MRLAWLKRSTGAKKLRARGRAQARLGQKVRAVLAIRLPTLLSAAGLRLGIERQEQSRALKRSVPSLVRQGWVLYELTPMAQASLRLLIEWRQDLQRQTATCAQTYSIA